MNRAIVALAILLIGYIVYSEWRFWDYAHVAYDAQTAICHAVPAHCGGVK